MVPLFVAVLAFRLAGTPRLGDHVDIAVGNKTSRVAGLQRSKPKRSVRGLWGKDVGNVRPLVILVVKRRRKERRILSRGGRTIDVDRQVNAITHSHRDVAFLNYLDIVMLLRHAYLFWYQQWPHLRRRSPPPSNTSPKKRSTRTRQNSTAICLC